MKNTIIKIEVSVLIAVLVSCCFNITAFSRQCDGIRDKMLRLHVVANSDSKEDQELKLKVRDAVLQAGAEFFDGSINADDAQSKLTPHIYELEEAAEREIEKNGYNYDVKISVQKEYFKTRTYDNSVTLPAGNYMAIKVIIGEGKGQNWWCVMFPPMCLPAAGKDCVIDDYLNNDEVAIVKNGNKYKLQFKLLEYFEEMLIKFK